MRELDCNILRLSEIQHLNSRRAATSYLIILISVGARRAAWIVESLMEISMLNAESSMKRPLWILGVYESVSNDARPVPS